MVIHFLGLLFYNLLNVRHLTDLIMYIYNVKILSIHASMYIYKLKCLVFGKYKKNIIAKLKYLIPLTGDTLLRFTEKKNN